MQFNISFKTIFEYILKKLVLCIQIRFVSTEKTTRIASRASCLLSNYRLSLFVCNDSSRLLLINYNNCINGIQPLFPPPGHFPHPDISHHLPNPLRDNSTPDISPHSTNYPI